MFSGVSKAKLRVTSIRPLKIVHVLPVVHTWAYFTVTAKRRFSASKSAVRLES